MSSAVVLFEDFAAGAALSGGNYLASLPRENAQDDDVQVVARTVDATNASTILRIDIGLEQQIGGLVLGPTNISPGATYRVRSFSNADFDANSHLLYDSGTKEVPGAVIDWSDVNDWLEWENPGFWFGIDESNLFPELPTWLAEIIPSATDTDALARYWQWEIFDEDNAAGYVQFGRALVARAFRPSINYGENNALTIQPLTIVSESPAGKRVYEELGLRRTWRCSFDRLAQDEIFGDVFRLMIKLRTSRQLFVVPDPSDTANFLKRSFLATFRDPPALQQLLVARGSTAFDLEEVI